MKRSPLELADILANHDFKVVAIARGNLQSARQYAETSSDYALHVELLANRITRREFNAERNARLRDRAERLRRAGGTPGDVAGMLARDSVFTLTVRHIRRILRRH